MADPLATARAEALRDAAALLEDRLHQLQVYGGDCACHHAEARAFLARLRELAARAERGGILRPAPRQPPGR